MVRTVIFLEKFSQRKKAYCLTVRLTNQAATHVGFLEPISWFETVIDYRIKETAGLTE